MEQDEWRRKFIGRLMEVAVPQIMADEVFAANIDDHDYTEDPIDAANEEMSYWDD